MKKYKFTRIGGHRPVEESDYDHIIRASFEPCTDEAKARLEAFFKDAGQRSVMFEFDDEAVVIVERETK